jgi:hypothetical protein
MKTKAKKLTQDEIRAEREIRKNISRQINAAGRVITRSTAGKLQQRSTGSRSMRNVFTHSYGTIGCVIDTLVLQSGNNNPRYSKAEFAALAGTKVSKVNSHLNNELRKKFDIHYSVDPVTGKLLFDNIGESFLENERIFK